MSAASRPPEDATVAAFIDRWKSSQAAEHANYAFFLAELCDALAVPRPEPTTHDLKADAYVIERPVRYLDTAESGRIDLYRRGHFVLETKQGVDAPTGKTRATGHGVRGTNAWERAMTSARHQAERYARNLGTDEPVPPFVIVADVGYSFDLYADFSGVGRVYSPFPAAGQNRIFLQDLERRDTREMLRAIWLDPFSLDPTRRQARVTKVLARRLATLAESLEQSSLADDERQEVPRFLTRCLFAMFAEDAGLIPERAFSGLLERWASKPEGLPYALADFFGHMDRGGYSSVIEAKLPRFNGSFFADVRPVPLTHDQAALLLEAAQADWRDVEPAIFGTLLERALDPRERSKLGAHFTPRAYVERLIVPTIIEPLRAQWEDTQTAVARIESRAEEKITGLRQDDKLRRDTRSEVVAELRRFLGRLASVRVLDPACGSGNFLYVALDHLKRLEAEVLKVLGRYGEATLGEMEEGLSVTPKNLLGIEVNPRSASIADLVLWIGHLQWHLRAHGSAQTLREPILKNLDNIRCADAVLDYDARSVRLGADGDPVTRWDGISYVPHPVTGKPVPDTSAQLPVYEYANPRPAPAWPSADFIVGNPPFIGSQNMRDELGDTYTEALRKAYEGRVTGSADFVMYWWVRAAETVRRGEAQRFGFISTNSITQTLNRRMTADQMSATPPLSLVYAIADHPWVDTAKGASVRIAMTVGALGEQTGTLATVVKESAGDEAREVELREVRGRIHPNLTVGVRLEDVQALRANASLSFMGVKLVGKGFLVSEAEARSMGLGTNPAIEPHIRPLRTGRDLTKRVRGVQVLDFYGLSEEDLKARFPEAYQHLLIAVKPEREAKRGRTADSIDYANRWYQHAKPRPQMRRALAGLPRFIATSEVAKHRLFVFLDASVLPDGSLIAIASADAYHLGLLSSRPHVEWSLALGGRMGAGNDPRYNSTRCFETFPFPAAEAAQVDRIRSLGEEIERHRRTRQSIHADLELTDLYNVLEALRAGHALTEAERRTHDAGMVSVLLDLHRQLDAAVLDAYGWPHDLTNEAMLEKLVELNMERQAEEASGQIRYVRAPSEEGVQGTLSMVGTPVEPRPGQKASPGDTLPPWPTALPLQVRAIRDLIEHRDAPITAADVSAAFQSAKVAEVADVLGALVEMGLLHQSEGRYLR